jgi:hypothetical protein
MTIGLNSVLRDARLQIVLDAIDDGADEYSSQLLTIYDSDRPATGGAVDEYDLALAEFLLPYPCGTITDGVLTFDTIADVVAIGTGSAKWARITDAGNSFVMDLSVSNLTGSGDVKLDSLSIELGNTVHCHSAILTEGNP